MPDHPQTDFIHFVWNRNNRLYIGSAIVISVVLWLVFKHFYPYPNIIWDSYFYTNAAADNADVNNWPIGYSRFIRFIGLFSHAPNVLLTTQYFFLVVCFLYFFLTLRFFFRLGKWTSNILFCFLFLNPIFFYISNLVLSDTLFTGISLLWVCQLIWIIFRPRPYMLFTHALLVLLAFATRYYALYYPFAACLFFLLSRQQLPWKIAGIVLQFIIVGWFIRYTTNKMEVTVGVKQFSPFGGWKLASNALYMYDHVQPDKSDSVPQRFRELDKMVRKYFDTPHEKQSLLKPDYTWGSFYMFIYPPSPLIEYQLIKQAKDTTSDFKKFSAMGPLFEAYGNYLIRKYPAAFAEHIVWPNVILYMVPHGEVFADSTNPFFLRPDIGVKTQKWFGLKTISIPIDYIRLRTKILSPYPILNALIHIIFITSCIGFFAFNGYQKIKKPYSYAILAITGLWLCNYGFTILSAGSLLRYQLFICVVEFAFALFFIEFIANYEDEEKVTPP